MRLSKTQFSFGQHNKDMSKNQTLYASEIDKQGKNGGRAADGRQVSNQMKKTSFTIGNNNQGSTLRSEANQ